MGGYWKRTGSRLWLPSEFEEQGIMKDDKEKLEDILAKWIETECSEVSWANLMEY